MEIKEQLQDIFGHPEPNTYNKDLMMKIQEVESVGIHVRRGDYLNEPEFRGICGIEYYKKQYKMLSRMVSIIVFIFLMTWNGVVKT